VAVEVGTGYVSITPSAKGFGSSLSKQIGGDLEGVGKVSGGKAGKGFMSGMGGALKVGVAAVGIGALAGITKKALGNAREAQQITNITEATIKATGGAAGVTASHVQEMANALQRTTGISDETIRSGSNVILTFKNIANAAGDGNNIFDQTTQAALDLSAAGFGSVQSASTMLGKALNDPLKGMSALTRVGVTFTDSQREQVKAAMENNDILGAQKIILAEVQGQVGGVAEAAADPMAKLNNMFNDLLETIGMSLLPALNAIADALGPLFEELGPIVGEVASLLGEVLADAVKSLTPVFRPMMSLVAKSAQLLGGALGRVIEALAPVIVELLDALMPLLDVFMELLAPLLDLVAVLIEGLMPIIRPIIGLIAALARILANGLAAVIENVLVPAVSFISDLIGNKMGPAFESIADFVSPVVDFFQNTVGPVIVGIWEGIQSVVSGFVDFFQGTALPVIQGVIDFIIGYYQTLWGIVQNVWSSITGFISGAVSRISSVMGTISGVVQNVIGFFGNLLSGVQSTMGNLLSFVSGIPGKILSFLWGLPRSLYGIGVSMIQSLINGAGSLLRRIGEFFLNMLPGWIVGPFKAALGIGSPSKVMMQFGEDIGDGLVIGIHAKAMAVEGAMKTLSMGAIGAVAPQRFASINGSASFSRIGPGGNSSMRPKGGLVIQELNVNSAPGERAEESVPRALRRLAFVSGL
jgi:phage-related protein